MVYRVIKSYAILTSCRVMLQTRFVLVVLERRHVWDCVLLLHLFTYYL
jgi:hypothetical protein